MSTLKIAPLAIFILLLGVSFSCCARADFSGQWCGVGFFETYLGKVADCNFQFEFAQTPSEIIIAPGKSVCTGTTSFGFPYTRLVIQGDQLFSPDDFSIAVGSINAQSLQFTSYDGLGYERNFSLKYTNKLSFQVLFDLFVGGTPWNNHYSALLVRSKQSGPCPQAPLL